MHISKPVALRTPGQHIAKCVPRWLVKALCVCAKTVQTRANPTNANPIHWLHRSRWSTRLENKRCSFIVLAKYPNKHAFRKYLRNIYECAVGYNMAFRNRHLACTALLPATHTILKAQRRLRFSATWPSVSSDSLRGGWPSRMQLTRWRRTPCMRSHCAALGSLLHKH